MVRSLLFALLIVAAVAWPAAAQDAPLVETPAVEDPLVAAAVLLEQSRTAVGPACRPYDWTWDPSDGMLPDFTVTVDPDHCIGDIVDAAWDAVWPFWFGRSLGAGFESDDGFTISLP